MQSVQVIRCPNCGSLAERHYFQDSELVRTQCDSCDYLLVTCDRTGQVIEAYAPGLCLTQVRASYVFRATCEALS
ncbi:MAG: replication restart DNA helicase PriA [Cyanobacteria bacterium]|nr:replication restart DNA helicase PriA [Cyanobacteriota bacterium]MDW8202778.1 replication restart DNA helicase PriA [Cyanobacteriota bacterium SKYGB_h_bin112]